MTSEELASAQPLEPEELSFTGEGAGRPVLFVHGWHVAHTTGCSSTTPSPPSIASSF